VAPVALVSALVPVAAPVLDPVVLDVLEP